MCRLFVAIDLPEDLKKMVSGIGRDLPGARRVPGEQLHLTLRFIGEVDDTMFKAVRTALTEIHGPPFQLALRGVGHFPPGRNPRVLWAGLDVSAPLLELQQKVELMLIKTGILPEQKKFAPHLSIARLKETPPENVALLEKQQTGFTAGPFPVTDFHLYASTLTSAGANHEKMATYPLVNHTP